NEFCHVWAYGDVPNVAIDQDIVTLPFTLTTGTDAGNTFSDMATLQMSLSYRHGDTANVAILQAWRH
ncbi:hypothetical protein A2U01_0056478, partial [Trifolium medium]|nr:hypothetical protein [Trifolium medium]